MTCFRTCAVDNKSAEEVSKRWGLLNVVNQLFKIYFRVNKVHLSKPLIRAIESSNLKDKYPKSQQVTYKYYVGRKHMFDYDFKARLCILGWLPRLVIVVIHVNVQNLKGGVKVLIDVETVENPYFTCWEVLKTVKKI